MEWVDPSISPVDVIHKYGNRNFEDDGGAKIFCPNQDLPCTKSCREAFTLANSALS
jgi:hypothetical protein